MKILEPLQNAAVLKEATKSVASLQRVQIKQPAIVSNLAKHEQWLWSDHHFFHANILKFLKEDGTPLRPFKDLDEMHQVMIDNWNKHIQPADYVYLGGDLVMRKWGKSANELMARLNGHKRLYLGNHEAQPKGTDMVKWFDKICLWKVFDFGGDRKLNFTLSHLPMHFGSVKGNFNVHGHTHYKDVVDEKGNIDPRYFNISVEKTNYRPLHIDEILTELKNRL